MQRESRDPSSEPKGWDSASDVASWIPAFAGMTCGLGANPVSSPGSAEVAMTGSELARLFLGVAFHGIRAPISSPSRSPA
jgi:hypothetical protein